jgi:hypothetical protein
MLKYTNMYMLFWNQHFLFCFSYVKLPIKVKVRCHPMCSHWWRHSTYSSVSPRCYLYYMRLVSPSINYITQNIVLYYCHSLHHLNFTVHVMVNLHYISLMYIPLIHCLLQIEKPESKNPAMENWYFKELDRLVRLCIQYVN